MNIIEISEEEFNTYDLDKNPNVGLFLKESYWFKNDNNNLVGTVIFDKSDKDWAYMIMAKESDDIYRAFDFKHSLEEEEAISLLKLNMGALSSENKIEETLYKEQDVSSIEPKQIIVTDINDELKRYFKKHPEKLYDLSPREFEKLVASILRDFGFDVELTKATRDGGTDIIAHIRNSITSFLMLVECKRYSPENKVDVGIVREVIGVHHIKQPAKSLIVTTSTFTKDATNIVSSPSIKGKIELKDYYDIKEWLDKY